MSRVDGSSARRVLPAFSAAVGPRVLALLLALTAAAAVMLAQAASSAAAAIIVNTITDEQTSADGLCSLREAFNNANAQSDTTGGDCVAGTGSDTITFSVSGTIGLSNGLPATQHSLTIDGTGQTITIDGASSFLVFMVNAAATLDVRDLTVTNGNETAINNGTMTVTHSTFTGNTGTVVMFNQSTGTLTVTGSTFTGTFAAISNSGKLTVTQSTFSNTSGGFGGGAISSNNEVSVSDSSFSGGGAFTGGAIFCSGGTATIGTSTFSGNTAAGSGGAIATSASTGCTLTVANCTFSGNNAFSLGGAIFNGQPGQITVTNSTFSGNSGVAGGGIDNQSVNAAAFTVTNSIVAGNGGGNCGGSGIVDGGHNIDGGTTCGFTGTGCALTTGTSFCSTTPALVAAGLADNGGPTQTIALQAGSPAIDAGDEAVCTAPPVNNLDQRGFTRPGTGATHCSIGAYEFNGQDPSAPTPTPTQTPTPTNTSTPTAMLPTPTPTLGLCTVCGDANGDGKADIVDALFIAQLTVELRSSVVCLTVADVNGDQVVTIVDALFIAQYTVGLRPVLQCGVAGAQ